MPTLFVGFASDLTIQDAEFEPFPLTRDLPRTAGTVVLLVDACTHVPELIGSRQSDFNEMLRRGARLVLVFGRASHAQGSPPQGAHTPFFQWLAQKIGLSQYVPVHHGIEVRSERSDLSEWFAEQSGTVLVEVSGEAFESLATAVLGDGSPMGVAAARWTLDRSEVIVLPHRHAASGHAAGDILDLLQTLPGRDEAPAYIEQVVTADDAELKAQLDALDVQRQAILDRLAFYRTLKRVLYQSGTDLQREVVRFLADELGVPARHVAGTAEDFWLVQGDGTDWCIGEVKSGEKRNIERPDLLRLVLHRSEAGKPDDFPALLVGNTFFRLSTLTERDQPMPPNQISYAAGEHVSIVRTLDLFRLKQRELRDGASEIETLLDFIASGGGWLEVTADLEIVTHTKQ